MKIISWVIALAVLLASCNQGKKVDTTNLEVVSDTTSYEHVSMINLIANPQQYHGKRVIVYGFVHVEFEGNIIYFSETDFKYNLDKNALYLYLSREEMNSTMFQKCQNKYAFVKGIFDMNALGHFSANSGGITNIVLAEPLQITTHSASTNRSQNDR